MDNLVYEESMSSEPTTSEFISKKWAYVNDNNVGNYSNQIVIDTTPLANTGAYVGWNEAYILMPLVVQLTADNVANLGLINTITDNCGDETWAFKNGFWQMIHSMSVEFNNGNAVQQYPFLNVFASFKAQTSFSDADVFNHGDGIGFYMDNAESWTFQSALAPSAFETNNGNKVYSNGDGVGLCNNKNYPPANWIDPYLVNSVNSMTNTIITPTSVMLSTPTDNLGVMTQPTNNSVRFAGKPYPSGDVVWNEGMRKRQQSVNRCAQDGILVGTTAGGLSYTGQQELMPIASLNQVWATHQRPFVNGARGWNIYAKLRLKDLADFFHKCPLLKGATMRFVMNTNQAITSFQITNTISNTAVANVGTPTLFNGGSYQYTNPLIAPNTINVVGGMTNPLMIASNAIQQGTNTLNAGTYKLSVSIVKCNFTEQSAYVGLFNTALQSCRLYAPLYKFDPVCEKHYLSLKTKTITYKDVISYQFTAIPASTNFNILVSQGVKNIKSVLSVPLISANFNAPLALSTDATITTANLTHPSTLMSPFSTTGATPDPIILNNYNVAIGGVNIFLQDEMYDFEAFKQQLASSNQLNGNLTTGLTSGLISEKMFSYLYRYYYANCERELPTEAGKERSIQVKGRNLSTTTIDLLVFVEYERTIVVSLEDGQRVG